MSRDLLLVIALLLTCGGLFVVNKPRMDVVAVLVIVIFPLSGILNVSEALPAELDQVAPALRQAPFALLSVALMVFLMVTGLVPNVIAALLDDT